MMGVLVNYPQTENKLIERINEWSVFQGSSKKID